MTPQDAIRFSIESASQVATAYLGDLSDAELLHRPGPGCNHINWQVGHLIAAENRIISQAIPGSMPPLPPGFAEKYTPETAKLDNPSVFCTKAELLSVHEQQRAAVLAALAKTSRRRSGQANDRLDPQRRRLVHRRRRARIG